MSDDRPARTERGIARLRQIRELLLESQSNEQAARRRARGATATVERLPAETEIRFLVERAELYNEEAQIEADLLHAGELQLSTISEDRIVALARELDLGRKLREERRARASAKDCTVACEVCVTSCTECVTACGLDGSNFGSDCPGTIVSACRPDPGA